MVEGAIVCPRPVSSPQIRRYPKVGLSRAISSASQRIAGPVRGRPGAAADRSSGGGPGRRASAGACEG